MPRISLLNITFKNSIAVSTCTIFEIRDCRFLRVNLSLITSQVRHRDSLEPHTIYVHCFLTLQMLLFGMFSKLFCSWNIFVFFKLQCKHKFWLQHYRKYLILSLLTNLNKCSLQLILPLQFEGNNLFRLTIKLSSC